MIKSLKGQFILSILVALAFIYNSFNYIEFTGMDNFYLPRLLLYISIFFSILVVLVFVYVSFYYIEFNGKEKFYLTLLLLYIAMIFSVYNAGILTQKYIQSKKK